MSHEDLIFVVVANNNVRFIYFTLLFEEEKENCVLYGASSVVVHVTAAKQTIFYF